MDKQKDDFKRKEEGRTKKEKKKSPKPLIIYRSSV